MKKLLITLPDDIYQQLETAAKEGHVSMAEITRRSLYDYLNSPYHDDSAQPGYIEGIAGKPGREGGKIAGHGGKRKGAGRRSKKE